MKDKGRMKKARRKSMRSRTKKNSSDKNNDWVVSKFRSKYDIEEVKRKETSGKTKMKDENTVVYGITKTHRVFNPIRNSVEGRYALQLEQK